MPAVFHNFNEWSKTRLPALVGLAYLQAVKRDEDGVKIIALIDNIEQLKSLPASRKPKIDFGNLRRLPIHPPKAD